MYEVAYDFFNNGHNNSFQQGFSSFVAKIDRGRMCARYASLLYQKLLQSWGNTGVAIRAKATYPLNRGSWEESFAITTLAVLKFRDDFGVMAARSPKFTNAFNWASCYLRTSGPLLWLRASLETKDALEDE